MSALRDRRYFPRVNLRAHATLSSRGKTYPVHLLDVSFKGALAALIHPHVLRDGDEIYLTIDTDKGTKITMRGSLSHQREHFLGLECQATNIENKSRLHELIRYLELQDQSRTLDQILNDQRHNM